LCDEVQKAFAGKPKSLDGRQAKISIIDVRNCAPASHRGHPACGLAFLHALQWFWLRSDCKDFFNNDQEAGKIHKSIGKRMRAMRMGAAAVLIFSGALSIAQSTPDAKPKRFTQLTIRDVPPQSKALAQEIVAISSEGLADPYNVMLRSPVLQIA
jgi:hypothetical protein